MKSSYKLYGVFWDKRFVSGKIRRVRYVDNDSNKDNTAMLSTIMASENPETHKEGSITSIAIDFVPQCSSTAVWDLYLKRVLQITEYYGVELICENMEFLKTINMRLDGFYKRKTPEGLLAQSIGAFQVI